MILVHTADGKSGACYAIYLSSNYDWFFVTGSIFWAAWSKDKRLEKEFGAVTDARTQTKIQHQLYKQPPPTNLEAVHVCQKIACHNGTSQSASSTLRLGMSSLTRMTIGCPL